MPDSRSGDAGSKARTIAEFPARSTKLSLARIILVLGTPGVGKSSLARRLAASLGLMTVDIGALTIKEGLYRRFDKTTNSYVIDEARIARRLLKLLSGQDLVVSSHFVGKILAPGRVRMAIVLRLDPLVLYKRLRSKGWTVSKTWENVESELIDVCLFEAVSVLGKAKVFEIDTTTKPLSRVLSESLKIVKGAREGWRSRVDWLQEYDPIQLERRLNWKSSF